MRRRLAEAGAEYVDGSRGPSLIEVNDRLISDDCDFVLSNSGMIGAYAWNISHHNFLMHPEPGFHCVGSGWLRERAIRRACPPGAR